MLLSLRGAARRMAERGLDAMSGTPEEPASQHRSEITRRAKVVNESEAKAG